MTVNVILDFNSIIKMWTARNKILQKSVYRLWPWTCLLQLCCKICWWNQPFIIMWPARFNRYKHACQMLTCIFFNNKMV